METGNRENKEEKADELKKRTHGKPRTHVDYKKLNEEFIRRCYFTKLEHKETTAASNKVLVACWAAGISAILVLGISLFLNNYTLTPAQELKAKEISEQTNLMKTAGQTKNK